MITLMAFNRGCPARRQTVKGRFGKRRTIYTYGLALLMAALSSMLTYFLQDKRSRSALPWISINGLTLYHTITTFNDPEKENV